MLSQKEFIAKLVKEDDNALVAISRCIINEPNILSSHKIVIIQDILHELYKSSTGIRTRYAGDLLYKEN